MERLTVIVRAVVRYTLDSTARMLVVSSIHSNTRQQQNGMLTSDASFSNQGATFRGTAPPPADSNTHMWCMLLLLPCSSICVSLQGCSVHKAFQSQRRPVRLQAQVCVRAEQGAEDRHQAQKATIKRVTAFLAAGVVLLPHAALAVSGGGGMLTQILIS